MSINFKETAEYADFIKIKEESLLRDKMLYTETFGCQQNEADTEKIRGMLTDLGMRLTEDPSAADVIIINTCAIREHAELKALSILGHFKALKREKPELIVGVVGCMAAEPKRQTMIKEHFRYVTFTLEPSLLHRLPTVLYSAIKNGGRHFVLGEGCTEAVEGIPQARVSDFRAWVSIMYGCNNFCTYCIVPYVRGRERSRDSAAVIEECRELVRGGIKEITLLGQNVNSYRADVDFAGLLEKIALIEGDFIIRFMTSHPKDVSPRLIEVMRLYNGKIAPSFHLPLQSGSDRILKAMNRTYTREKYLVTVDALRTAIPEISITTDIIVGFPGETEEDFQGTMDVLRTVKFDSVFSFIYSPRAGTVASKMEYNLDKETTGRRMRTLLDAQTEISAQKNLVLVGTSQRVLVEGRSKKEEADTYTARTAGGKRVHFSSETDVTGQFVTVKIERAGAFDLFGSVTNENNY